MPRDRDKLGRDINTNKSHEQEIRELGKIQPERYRRVKFVNEVKLLGQQIEIGGNGHIAANDRFGKAIEACGWVGLGFKIRIFRDKGLTFKTKWCIW